MHAYVINMAESVDRKNNMSNVLSGIENLEFEFITAINGRKLADNEIQKKFNIIESEKRYFKKIQLGEIGCTLSHQKFYKQLLASNYEYVFIFEDDIYLRFSKDEISKIFKLAVEQLNNNIPTVILFSGWNYYTNKKRIDQKYYKTKVVDGYLAHAYLINRKAAELMIEERPWMLADNWKYFIKKGIKILGIIPHSINQNGKIKSDITSSMDRFKFNGGFIQLCFRRFYHLLFMITGHFEKPDKDYIC